MDKNKRKKGRSRNNKKVDSHTRINVNKNESIFQVLKGLHITQDLPYRVMKSNIMGRGSTKNGNNTVQHLHGKSKT
ncbi:hypothetical protein M8J77_012552 [Diaphorina citri]|nr:hypothetical protein M8J77_012552 [Diaphorina citri]